MTLSPLSQQLGSGHILNEEIEEELSDLKHSAMMTTGMSGLDDLGVVLTLAYNTSSFHINSSKSMFS